MAENKRDYYEVLGLSKGADEDAIKKAYRTLAKKYHPDMNPGDADAEKKFKEINEAYAVLSDADKKMQYDQFGHSAFDPSQGGFGGFDFNGGFDISDIFTSFFGGGMSSRRNGPIRGEDVNVRITLAFEEAVFGVKKEISFPRVEKCDECSGSGAAKGTSAETCSVCSGSGQVRVQQRTSIGMIMQTTKTCDACKGKGKIIQNPCAKCRGAGQTRVQKKLDVTIPAGIDNGQRVALRSEGNHGLNGGGPGDLIITVMVNPHSIFDRDGYDLYCEVPITFAEAALGAEINIPVLDPENDSGTPKGQKYTIPEGTQTGTKFILKQKGVQMVNSRGKGDLHFTVTVEVPKNLTEQQKTVLRNFAESCGENNHAKREKFFKRFFNK